MGWQTHVRPQQYTITLAQSSSNTANILKHVYAHVLSAAVRDPADGQSAAVPHAARGS